MERKRRTAVLGVEKLKEGNGGRWIDHHEQIYGSHRFAGFGSTGSSCVPHIPKEIILKGLRRRRQRNQLKNSAFQTFSPWNSVWVDAEFCKDVNS